MATLVSAIHIACARLAQALDSKNVKYAIMGGAACFILGSARETEDVDLVVDVASGDANDQLNAELKALPGFTGVDVGNIGHFVPAVVIPGGRPPVPLDIFDRWSWEERPQYADVTSHRVARQLPDRTTVYVFSPAWLLREKVASVQERRGKLETQLQDIQFLCSPTIIPPNEYGQGLLDFRQQLAYAEHLRRFLERNDIPQDIRSRVAQICRI